MTRVVHCKKEKYDVYIGRPSKWGNPFSHMPNTLAKFRVKTREEAISEYREWITKGDGKHLLKDLHELRDKTLGCWCKPLSCHGDVLKELVKTGTDICDLCGKEIKGMSYEVYDENFNLQKGLIQCGECLINR